MIRGLLLRIRTKLFSHSMHLNNRKEGKEEDIKESYQLLQQLKLHASNFKELYSSKKAIII